MAFSVNERESGTLGKNYRIEVYVHVEPRQLGVETAAIRNRRHEVIVSIAEDTFLGTVVAMSVLCFRTRILSALPSVYSVGNVLYSDRGAWSSQPFNGEGNLYCAGSRL